MKKVKICEFSPSDLLLDCIKEMTERAKLDSSISLGVVLEKGKILGSISDGDIRRYLVSSSANINSDLAKDVMNIDPFCISEESIPNIKDRLLEINRKINYAFIKDKKNNYLYSIELKNFLEEDEIKDDQASVNFIDFDKTVVVGLGFVGLTLAVHIAKSGFPVIGIDSDQTIIKSLNKKEIPFYEQGMQSALDELESDSLSFKNNIPKLDSEKRNIFIIAVGTPITNNSANFDQLESSIRSINEHISHNDLLVIRSTVPIGTCKEFISKFIDPDKRVHICMAPERTAEGIALSELQILPQIIGADDYESGEIAKKYFERFSSSVINAGSTTAAEISKLVCNSYRDLNFGFANELALLCEDLQIDAFDLISNCNIGYKRMNMPLPSPGVGGYCLSKDPILYANSGNSISNLFEGKLSKFAREANIQAGLSPDRAINHFQNHNLERKKKKLKILVCGVAFKGSPETDDVRFSTSMDFVNRMIKLNHNVFITDASKMTLKRLQNKFQIFNFDKKIDNDFDAIVVLNNNPKNLELNYSDWLNNSKIKMFFDGWHQFSSYRNNFKAKNTTYATMGAIK